MSKKSSTFSLSKQLLPRALVRACPLTSTVLSMAPAYWLLVCNVSNTVIWQLVRVMYKLYFLKIYK